MKVTVLLALEALLPEGRSDTCFLHILRDLPQLPGPCQGWNSLAEPAALNKNRICVRAAWDPAQ